MPDALALSLISLIVILVLLALAMAFWLLQQRAHGRRLEASRAQLEQQLAFNGQQLAQLGEQMAQARAEAKEEAQRAAAAQQLSHNEHLHRLQTRMHEALSLTHAQVESGRQATDARLQHLSGNLTQQLGSHTKVIMQVQEQLGALGQAAQGMQELGRDISGLQDILRAPKLRGNLGEMLLAEILRQVLPPQSFALQHRFAGDTEGSYTIVDAVIHLGERLVPIDSKFPLESFQRLVMEAEQSDGVDKKRARKQFFDVVRAHIDDVARKYIRPDAKTYDFALTYLPAENVYYEAIVRPGGTDETDSIVAYAAQRRVMVVSPSTLYAYLLTVAYGLKGMRIEHQAEMLRGQLAAFNKKFVAFYKDVEKTGRHLDLAHRSLDDVLRRGSKLNDQVGKMTGAALHLGEPDAEVTPLTSLSSAGDPS